MFKAIFLIAAISALWLFQQSFQANAQEQCLGDVLEKGGSYRILSPAEADKVAAIRKNTDVFKDSLRNAANTAAVFDDNGEVSYFIRNRRDEMVFTAIYVCLGFSKEN